MPKNKKMFSEMQSIAEGTSEYSCWFANFCEPGGEGGIIIALSPSAMSPTVSQLVKRLKEEVTTWEVTTMEI